MLSLPNYRSPVSSSSLIRINPDADLPPPVECGLPGKFTVWRDQQVDAINRILASDKRFVTICMPTGGGKSLCAIGAALLSGRRTVLLTSTKGLQDQVSSEFGNAVVADIRGMANYSCPIAAELGVPASTTVADAPCQCGYNCRMRGRNTLTSTGCEYFDRYRTVLRSDITVTNYQCWMHDGRKDTESGGSIQFGFGTADDRPIGMLIMDECFAAGTHIDGRPIESIRAGDYVRSLNEASKGFEMRKVTKIWKRKSPIKICKLHFSDGHSVRCTLTHPFLTRQGWLPAYKLLLGTVQCLSSRRSYGSAQGVQVHQKKDEISTRVQDNLLLVPQTLSSSRGTEMFRVPKQRKQGLLRSGLCSSFDRQPEQEYDTRKPQNAFRPYETAQPDGKSGSKSKGAGYSESNGMEASSAGGKRSRAIHLSEIACFDIGLADGSSNWIGAEEAFFSDVLQGGHCISAFASCNRSGWGQPSGIRAQGFRQEEGQETYWTWVEGFEIYEQTDREEFERVCPGGYVYNLEVEGTHTYIAEGFVVHNCHDAPEQLGMFVGEEISRKECLQLHLVWPDSGGTVDDWREWAWGHIEGVAERLKSAELRVRNSANGRGWSRELKHLRDMNRKLERLSAMQMDDEWVITENDRNASAGTMSGVRFDPLNPARYAESALFRGIEKVVLVSATLRPKTAQMLGISNGDMEFVEYPSTFPVERRPIIHVPTIRMTFRNEQDDGLMTEWLKTLDAWIGPRIELGRKGIVHAVSYARMKFIVDNSKYAWCMMTHSTWDRERKVAEFRQRSGPCVLVSPSIGTGYDFAHGAARFQVIAKLPFASTQDPVIKARQERDKDYGLYQVAQDLQQSAGRINRAESDWGETLILDQNVEWAIPKMRAKGFLSRSWLDAFKSYDVAPPPITFPE